MKRFWSYLGANWEFALGLILLVVVGVITARTHSQNLALREAIRKTSAPVVQTGDFIEEVAGAWVDRTQVRFRLLGAAHGSLIIGMSSECGFCRQSIGSWRQLSAQARRLGLQVVWVNRDRIKTISSAQTVEWDPNVVVEPTYSTFVRLKLGTVPQTLVIEHRGLDSSGGDVVRSLGRATRAMSISSLYSVDIRAGFD